jgi:hypothetical protein
MEDLLKDSFFPNDLIKDPRKLSLFLDLIKDDLSIKQTLYFQCSFYGFFESFKLLNSKLGLDDKLIRKAYELSIINNKENIRNYLYKKYHWIINGTKLY